MCPASNYPSNVGGERLTQGRQTEKDMQMKRIYERAISLSTNECNFLNTSLERKSHPILEGGHGGGVGTWKSNHKGQNIDAN